MKTLKAVNLVTVITGLLTGLSLSSSASAQDISGTWHGKLTVPTGSLTLVFHINQTGEGTYITTLDSPDQGANGIKTQTTSFKDSILTVQTPVIHASPFSRFNGKGMPCVNVPLILRSLLSFPL